MSGLLVLSAVVAAVVALAVSRASRPRTVATAPRSDGIMRARAIHIVDDTGSSRIALGCDEHGPVIEIYGADKKLRAFLGIRQTGRAAMSLFDTQGCERSTLYSEEGSQSGMTLFDARNGVRVMLDVNDPDQTGEGAANLSLGSAGAAGLIIGTGHEVTHVLFTGHGLEPPILAAMATPTWVKITDAKNQVIWKHGGSQQQTGGPRGPENPDEA